MKTTSSAIAILFLSAAFLISCGVSESDFIDAATYDKPDVVKKYIEAGGDITVSDDNGETALMRAAWLGYVPICEMLIEAGADVNGVDNYGSTPLMFAAGNGQTEAIKLLIEKGAEVNKIKSDGKTSALIDAAWAGKNEAVEILLKNGADKNHTDKWNRDALIATLDNECIETTEFLIKKGASLKLLKKRGEELLANFVFLQKPKSVKFLLKQNINPDIKIGKNIDYETDNENFKLIQFAVDKQNTELVKILAEGGADLNVRELQTSYTPLMWAAEWGHYDIAKILVDNGADITLVNKNGLTAMEIAMQENKQDVVQLIERSVK